MKLSLMFNGLAVVAAATPLVFEDNSVNCAVSTERCLGFLDVDVLNPATYYNCMDEAERSHPECDIYGIGPTRRGLSDLNLLGDGEALDYASGDPDAWEFKCSLIHGSCIGKCGGLRKNPPCVKNCRPWTISIDSKCKNFRFPPIHDSKRELLEGNIEAREEDRINFFPAPEPTGDNLCDKCREDYRFCIEAAFIPGLPSCEGICKKHAFQKDSTCDSCDQSQYFPSYNLEKPVVEHHRT